MVARQSIQIEGDGSNPVHPLFYRTGEIADGKSLVLKHHYSRLWPANVQLVCTMHRHGGLFGDFGDCVATCVFCVSSTQWAESLLELSRLVRSPDYSTPLSGFVSMATASLLAIGTDLVVSYADETHKHHGGIYRACSWRYGGFRKPRKCGMLIDGQYLHDKTCANRWGTNSPWKLKSILSHCDVQPYFDDGKHLYWKPLNRFGRRKAGRLGLESNSWK